MQDHKNLYAPFPPDAVSWRVGATNRDKTKGLALAYVDARDVMQRLDDVVGPAGWQCEYPHANGKTVCSIGIKIGGEWIWKANGAGDTDVEAEKGALSDAFKRAAVCWGIGRYLYDIPQTWVAIEAAGKSYKISERELPRLRKLLGGNQPEYTEPATSDEKLIVESLMFAIDKADTLQDLRVWWSDPETQLIIRDLPGYIREDVEAYKDRRKTQLTESITNAG